MAEEYRHSLADANAENLDSDSAGETPTGDFLVKKMARTTKDSSSKKKKRVSKTAELENKLTSMEDRFDKKIDMLFAVLNKSCATTGSSTVAEISQSGGLATQREQSSDNVPSTGERRPVISLNANLDEDLGSPRIIRNIDFDNRSEISLHIDSREKADLLGLCSSEDEYSRGLGSPVSVYSQAGNKSRNVERFSQYLQTQPTIINNNVESQSNQRQTSNIDNNNNKTVDKQSDNLNLLSKLFKEDIPSESSDNSGGLIIDEAQVRILERSWRTKNPEKLTAFKDEYRSCFPVNDKSKSFLQVPSLDDLLEPMIRTVHGTNSVKSWDKHKQLVTQPLKQIENLAYQGQVASRMGIISVLYMQQTLGTLLERVENENVSDETCQMVKDLFAISTKSLDQVGRTGAFNHMIRRKAAATESGLNNLKDIQAKVLYLPLSNEGVFGKGLEDKLEKRKEQREQLDDLLPEYKNNNKRKFESTQVRQDWQNKAPRYSSNNSSTHVNYNNANSADKRSGFNYNKSSVRSVPRKFQKDNKADDFGKKDKEKKAGGNWNSFRIPKKNSS
ncbi:unnamed protein product [Mytilus edulis]|uniref:Uncharacterized protein n=1 Tax=Mytilus edulis TaxID=6550 RepID=A0A8S3VSA7_MYTED|nr:unnamed protein product [Mytilus edulis]